DPAERLNLFWGVAGAGDKRRLVGRYGPDLAPTGQGPAVFGNPPAPFYARVDYNGTSAAKLQPPLGTDCFPTFPTDYDNAAANAARDPRDPAGPEKLGGGGPKPFPPDRTLPPLVHSEFDPQSWRSLTAALGRIDLSRPLPDYPANAAADPNGFLRAQAARQG